MNLLLRSPPPSNLLHSIIAITASLTEFNAWDPSVSAVYESLRPLLIAHSVTRNEREVLRICDDALLRRGGQEMGARDEDGKRVDNGLLQDGSSYYFDKHVTPGRIGEVSTRSVRATERHTNIASNPPPL